ncbi:hypothetical protein NDU88_007260 [Pleurodeles waltl]|uniref:Uncharacterized protein n=1 Tax=Pleurodeles waltl TaxID=8319 RepID=A0AAV7TZ90_PLEWA|nr:hypothetical protein NDU88_007260 [Pleurodeles waltl]
MHLYQVCIDHGGDNHGISQFDSWPKRMAVITTATAGLIPAAEAVVVADAAVPPKKKLPTRTAPYKESKEQELWPCLTLRLLWRVARAVLKEYPGVLRTRLHPPTPVGLQHEQSKNNALVYWGTRLHSPTPVGV